MKKKQIKIIIAVIILLIITFFLITFIQKTKEKSFSIVMAGDALVTDSILKESYNELENNYQFSHMLKYIKEYIKDYDLAFYNQETPISGSNLGISGKLCYNTPSNFAIDMMNAGFNIINLANNHVMDGQLQIDKENNYRCQRNEEGVINNINFFKKYEKVYTTGIYESQEQKDKIIIKKQNGITYTVLSYTYGTNMDNIIEYKPFLVNVYSKEQVKRDIKKIRDKVDVIFVSMHWGQENSSIPTSEQKETAKYLASLGVDVIIGHHPHVIQPIEWIDNTLVIYSLGNLITAQETSLDYARQIGMLVDLKITKKNNKISLSTPNCELIYIYNENINNKKKNFVIIPYSYLKAEDELLRLYEKSINIIKLYDEKININKMGTKNLPQNIN